MAEVLAPVHPPPTEPNSAASPADSAAGSSNGAGGFDFKQYMQGKAQLIDAALDASVPLVYPQDVTAAMRLAKAPHCKPQQFCLPRLREGSWAAAQDRNGFEPELTPLTGASSHPGLRCRLRACHPGRSGSHAPGHCKSGDLSC